MSDYDPYSKTIKRMIMNAKKGNFFSAIELTDYFSDGKFIEPNSEEAKKFKNLSFDIFKNQSLKLKKISLSNFKGINEALIPIFDDNINIFIGNNGTGKTSILEAIELSLSWLSINISKNGGNGSFIDSEDINIFTNKSYASISSTISLNKNISATLELSTSKPGKTKIKNKLYEFKKIGSFYKVADDLAPDFNMPILAYYNLLRSIEVNKANNKFFSDNPDTKTDKFDAYQNSLNGTADFRAFVNWYQRIDAIDNQKMAKSIHEKQLSELGISEKTLNTLRKLAKFDADAKSSLEEIEQALSLKTNKNKNKNKNKKDFKQIINDIIPKFMDGFSGIEVQLEPYSDLIIHKNSKRISAFKLSQGEKSLLALILDISRRLMILNPSLENPLDGNGIILIDEFDLHLHPVWQNDIVQKLKTAFPNCQFFLTTHSPLVINNIDSSCIFILENDTNNSLSIRRPLQSKGLSASEILDELMSSNGEKISRPHCIETKLEKIFDLIEDSQKKSLELAEKLIKDLEADINGEIPDLVKAKMEIDFIRELQDEED